jgi:predicted Zn-dependent peptidase
VRPEYIGELSWVGAGYRTPGPGHADAPALFVLERLLGDGNGSVLFHRLRGELGVAYTVGAQQDWYASTGMMRLVCGCAPDVADGVAKEMCRIVEELGALVSEQDLRRAAARAEFELRLSFSSPVTGAEARAEALARGLSVDYGDEAAARIRALALREVLDAAHRWLVNPVVAIGNPMGAGNRQT